MTLSPRAIEVGARALCIAAGDDPDKMTYAHEMACTGRDREPKYRWEYWAVLAEAAISAAIAAEGLVLVPKEITTEIANRTWDSLPSHVQRGLTRPTSHFPGLNVLYRTMIAAAQPLPSPPKNSARSSAGSEQKRQVAGSNPAERASSSPQKKEG